MDYNITLRAKEKTQGELKDESTQGCLLYVSCHESVPVVWPRCPKKGEEGRG